MKRSCYMPEGRISGRQRVFFTPETLEDALRAGTVLESTAVLCDGEKGLCVQLGRYVGYIPREECAMEIAGAPVKDIAAISRVGKPVCFKVLSLRRDENGEIHPLLSRKAAQEECFENHVSLLCPGDVIDARITHLEPFGAFCDIGCGIISLLPVDCMSVSRVSHPRDRFRTGQYIRAAVKTVFDGRISLTHKELLGTWEENAARFAPGQTVAGIIRASERYGVFVELAPNLSGLAEPDTCVLPGQTAAVYIKSIIPEKMKVKLVIVDVCEGEETMRDYAYPDVTHIDVWRYSPEGCVKNIYTDFSAE